MCGMVGIACIKGPVPPHADLLDQLRQATHAIQHRGPDDEGVWISKDGRVGFGHRRLSILDLSQRGHQPMEDSDGNTITFNGEIYNFKELRGNYPHSDFQSESDTEVLLKGIAAQGQTFLKELDGMFAFGFVSQRAQQLLIAVDPAGKKPLYTYWDGKTFAFASEIKAFQAFRNLDFTLDKQNLKESLIYGYVPWPRTMYRYIRKLPAGHFQIISLRDGPYKCEEYWDVPLGQTDHKITARAARSTLREILGQAVTKRLISDVPVGCFLSGGVDSSVVALEAARAMPRLGLQTFAAGFSLDRYSRFYDETKFANQVAQQIKSNHHVLQVDASNVNATEIMRHFDEPFGDSSAIPTYLLCQETSKYVKVVLSGDGGDELFGGYLRFCAGLLSERYQSLWQVLLTPIRYLNPPPRSFLAKLQRFRSAVSKPLLERLAVWNSFFTEEELVSFFGESSDKIFQQISFWDDRTKGLPIGEKILYFNFKTYLFDDLLPKMDRMSMAHALEVRSPFLDKKLIEFAFRLPTALKFDAFRTKKILKDAYRPLLGSEIIDRNKHGFAFPLETFLRDRSWKEETSQLQHFFPEASLNDKALNSQNRFTKQFMLFCLNQNLLNRGERPTYVV
jgi:asparagine synthase (glutamine-hydrolysing)